MAFKDGVLLLSCISLFFFLIGFLYNKDTTNLDIYSRSYWDLTRIDFLNNYGFHKFLIGLTIVINRALMGMDELILYSLDLIGTRKICLMLIKLCDNSGTGVPTLMLICFILIMNIIIYNLYFRNKTNLNSKVYFNIEKNTLIKGLDKDIGKIIKLMVRNNQTLMNENKILNNIDSYEEIKKLEESVNKITNTSLQITESLYNFLSAFHIDYGEFPDSNDIYQDNIPYISKSYLRSSNEEYITNSAPYNEFEIDRNNSQITFENKFDDLAQEMRNSDYTDNFNKMNNYTQTLINTNGHYDNTNQYGDSHLQRNCELDSNSYSNLI